MFRLLSFSVVGVIILFVCLGFIRLLGLLEVEEAQNTVQVYFYRHEKLYPVKRPVPGGMAKETVALRELFTGPTLEEKSNLIQTMIPAGLKLHSVGYEPDKTGDGRILILGFDEAFLKISGGHGSIDGTLKQIVFTVTQIKDIKAVSFRLQGSSANVLVIGGEGYIIDRPLDRDYFKGVR